MLDLEPDAVLTYGNFRAGDVRHSLANIEKARQLLSYNPVVRVHEGLKKTIDWFVSKTINR